MPIAQSDLTFHAALNSPLNDVDTSGGAIDSDSRILESILSSRERLEVISDGADTRKITITGRNFGGEKVIEIFVLDGTNVVEGHIEFYTVLEILLDSVSATRTVSVRHRDDGTVIQTVGPNITKYTSLFKFAAPSESQVLTRYEKVFAKNNHASIDLLDPVIRMFANPSGNFEYALATAQDDSGSVANRLTAPAGLTFLTSLTDYTNIPSASDIMSAGSAIGVWVKQTLAAKERPSVANSLCRMLLVGATE